MQQISSFIPQPGVISAVPIFNSMDSWIDVELNRQGWIQDEDLDLQREEELRGTFPMLGEDGIRFISQLETYLAVAEAAGVDLYMRHKRESLAIMASYWSYNDGSGRLGARKYVWREIELKFSHTGNSWLATVFQGDMHFEPVKGELDEQPFRRKRANENETWRRNTADPFSAEKNFKVTPSDLNESFAKELITWVSGKSDRISSNNTTVRSMAEIRSFNHFTYQSMIAILIAGTILGFFGGLAAGYGVETNMVELRYWSWNSNELWESGILGAFGGLFFGTIVAVVSKREVFFCRNSIRIV